MAASVRDVAARAGVSPKTVSNVVHERPHVAEATRRRVLAAVAELGYRPNLSARNLRTGRTGLLTLAIPDLSVPYFAEMAHLVIAAAAERDYTVLIEETEARRDREARALQGTGDRLADGVIISPLALDPADLVAADGRLPIVLLGERSVSSDLDHVTFDNVAAARDATAHLLGLGRTRLAALGYQGDGAAATSRLRYRGFRTALAEAGRQPVGPPLPLSSYAWDAGAAAVDRLFEREAVPDGLVCFSDTLALGALRRLHELGYRVPGDVAVIGFDDIVDGRFVTPSLSSVAPDKRLLARTAVDCVLHRVGADTPPPPRDVVVGHTLAIRESTRGRRAVRRPALD